MKQIAVSCVFQNQSFQDLKSLELQDHWMRTLKSSKSENARLPLTNRPIQ